jgi:hypothetical protein
VVLLQHAVETLPSYCYGWVGKRQQLSAAGNAMLLVKRCMPFAHLFHCTALPPVARKLNTTRRMTSLTGTFIGFHADRWTYAGASVCQDVQGATTF